MEVVAEVVEAPDAMAGLPHIGELGVPLTFTKYLKELLQRVAKKGSLNFHN